MKKIFSILLALVLVVSLGLVTAAPMAAQSTVLDHFKCYPVAEWTAYVGEDVSLEDQFGAVEAVVGRAEFLCNPVAKWHEEMPPSILNWDHHLSLYSLYHEEEPQERIVQVENQFGTQQLVVSDPVLLGVPTQKEGHYPPVGLDHFLLYEVTEGPSVEVVVGLEDQFLSEYVSVYEPIYFANPVRKTHDGEVTEIENPEAHLVFYRIASYYSIIGDVWVYNQFGEQYLEVYMDEYNPPLLAVQSEKEPVQYTLTISSTAGGSVTAPGEGTFTYDAGMVVSLVATPATGYGFFNWAGDVDTITNVNAATTTITMDDNYSITANFEVIMPVQYSLTISSTTGGSVTTPGQGTFTYDEGTVVDLVASPTSGYHFVNWAGDVDTITNVNAATTTIIMQGDYEITARFLPGVVDTKTETVTDDTVDARGEADTEVEVDGTATVTVAKYEENPGGPPPTGFSSLDKYIDVYVPDTTEANELEIRLYYTDAELVAAGIDEESLRLFWWDGDDWVACSDSGVNTASSYIWAIITEATTPRLDQLQGTAWGGYGHPSTVPQPCGCFIATAAYGTDTAKEIDILREFRDAVLLPNSLGDKFVSLYYKISPLIANFISQHQVLRTAVRLGFVDPIVAMLNWSHHLWSVRGS